MLTRRCWLSAEKTKDKKKKKSENVKKILNTTCKIEKKDINCQKKTKIMSGKNKKNLWLTGTVRCPLMQPFYKSLSP